MATLLQVYNAALDAMGQKGTLVTVDDVTPSCQALNRAFPFAIAEFLRAHPWNWATHEATLTEPSGITSFDWDHVFDLPADYVTILRLNGNDVEGDPGDYYEIRGRHLLTDEAEAEVVYIRKPTDTGSGDIISTTDLLASSDPMAVRALVTLLASLAVPAIRSDGMEAAISLKQQYLTVDLSQAQMHDGNERSSVRYNPVARSQVIAARNGTYFENL
jgi:hypothetical protein